jgi:galactose mutarotase-like enzyme
MIEFDLTKVGNISQLGGIETSVIDNGPAKGVRVAWFNTGNGFRYKVAIDRAMDIVEACYNQNNLVWISQGGLTAPNPAVNQAVDWLYSFFGGLLTTCGLSHVGGPEEDEFGQRGIHGRISNIPATVESIIQPNPAAGKLEMSITGTMKESKVFGPSLQLKRSISSTLGRATIKIHDEVTNIGNMSAPHMILYHCNFGFPLVDEDVDILYKGDCKSSGGDQDNAIFNEKHDYKKCQRPLDIHRGVGGACGFIDVEPDNNGLCTVGLANNKLGIALVMKYKKQQLPCLTNWQHWGTGEYVCALEPGTNFPIGQNNARKQNKLIMLEPGEKRRYDMEFIVLSDGIQINNFLQIAGR